MTLTCCEPRRGPTPSGISWIHADDCTLDPKQIVVPPPGVASPTPIRQASLSRRHRLETASKGLGMLTVARPVSLELHPACQTAAADGRAMCSRCTHLSHLPGCVCETCSYFDEHDGGVA